MPAYTLSIKLVGTRCSAVGRANRSSAVGFLLLQRFSVSVLVLLLSTHLVSSVLNLDLHVCYFWAPMSQKSFTGTEYLVCL